MLILHNVQVNEDVPSINVSHVKSTEDGVENFMKIISLLTQIFHPGTVEKYNFAKSNDEVKKACRSSIFSAVSFKT